MIWFKNIRTATSGLACLWALPNPFLCRLPTRRTNTAWMWPHSPPAMRAMGINTISSMEWPSPLSTWTMTTTKTIVHSPDKTGMILQDWTRCRRVIYRMSPLPPPQPPTGHDAAGYVSDCQFHQGRSIPTTVIRVSLGKKLYLAWGLVQLLKVIEILTSIRNLQVSIIARNWLRACHGGLVLSKQSKRRQLVLTCHTWHNNFLFILTGILWNSLETLRLWFNPDAMHRRNMFSSKCISVHGGTTVIPIAHILHWTGSMTRLMEMLDSCGMLSKVTTSIQDELLWKYEEMIDRKLWSIRATTCRDGVCCSCCIHV